MSPDTGLGDPETARRDHLRRESEIKSVGQLAYLVAAFSALGILEFAAFAGGMLEQPPELKALGGPSMIQGLLWVLTAGFLLVTLAHIAIGYGLTHLQAWARWTVVVLTALNLVVGVGLSLVACLTNPRSGLISLAVGVAINGLILYPLLTRQSGVVFSKAYREVIRQTPTIRSRMHWLLKLLIGLILLTVLGFVGYLFAIYRGWIDGPELPV